MAKTSKTSKHTAGKKNKPASMTKTSRLASVLGKLGGRPSGSKASI